MSPKPGPSAGPDRRSSSAAGEPPRAQRGRPRDTDLDASISHAIIEVLAEVGYGSLTYELVAARAGASRPTLYRRAPNKVALVVDALIARYGIAPVPDTGSVEKDLLALQRAQVRLYNDPVIGAALPGLLADIRTDNHARDTWVNGFVRPRRDGVTAAIRRGIQRGELTDDTDPEWVCEILTGPLVSSAFLTGPHRITTHLAAETVALVLSRFQQQT